MTRYVNKLICWRHLFILFHSSRQEEDHLMSPEWTWTQTRQGPPRELCLNELYHWESPYKTEECSCQLGGKKYILLVSGQRARRFWPSCVNTFVLISRVPEILPRGIKYSWESHCQLCTTMGEREMFYLTTHSTHFIYGYMASDIWLRTILIVRKETRCRHIGYSYRLTVRVILYAPSHRQDNTYHSLWYTSRGALAGTRNSSMGPPHEGSIRRPIAPWANALPLSYVPLLQQWRL